MKREKSVLIDCDPGIDDALALFFAFASDRLKVEAVTTVYGNVSARQCTRNLIKILSLCGLKRLPDIGIGSKGPLVKRRPRPRAVHGKDGLGDTNLTLAKKEIFLDDAVELAIRKILSKSVDYIIATGPLTNIAKIVSKDPRVSGLIKRIYIMGGAISVKGNVTPYAEFNIYNDPEAASIVFSSRIPKTLVSLDVTQRVVLEKKDLSGLKESGKGLSRFISDIANYSIAYNRRFRGLNGASLHDPLCAGVAADEDICEYAEGRFDICLSGPERGRITASSGGGDKITYARGVDVVRFKELFLYNLNKLCKEAAN
ncbi:nucleoside hydrolase [Omnitrophica bacterium]|nr:nucleoside hydrolase [Candidatus Omnitrophota bacterium]